MKEEAGQSPYSQSIVVMGVSGSGKSTIGRMLAKDLGAEFVDGDDLHPAENVAQMAAGVPLNDSERAPWLAAVGETLQSRRAQRRALVVACSALKREYRDRLRDYVRDVVFVFLDGSIDLVHGRIVKRTHEFMPSSLLRSQFLSLEPLQSDEHGLRVDIDHRPGELVDQIKRQLLAEGYRRAPGLRGSRRTTDPTSS